MLTHLNVSTVSLFSSYTQSIYKSITAINNHMSVHTNNVNVLELFAGARSIGKCADELGMNVFSVDWKPFNGIDLCKDIGLLQKEDIPFIPDMIWASPDCRTYSIASIGRHRNKTEPISDYAKKCDQVNQHFINIIKDYLKINPDMVFFIENPRGMLRKMPFMQEFNRHTIWYCQYGDDNAKQTDIWTNSKTWIPKKPCHNGNKNCHHQPSPRGLKTKTGTQTDIIISEDIPECLITEKEKLSFLRSKIPNQLCLDIIHSIHTQ